MGWISYIPMYFKSTSVLFAKAIYFRLVLTTVIQKMSMSLLVVLLVIQNRCIYDLEKFCNRDTWSTAHFVEKVLLEQSCHLYTDCLYPLFKVLQTGKATKFAMLISLWFTEKTLRIPEL